MIKIYKTTETSFERLDSIQNGCWVDIINPTEEELQKVSAESGVLMEFLKAALDEEETSRIEVEEGQVFIIVDIPVLEKDDGNDMFVTIPLGIILTDKVIATVCLAENKIIGDFERNAVKQFYTYKKTRFILQILFKIATYYLIYLRQIDRLSSKIEKELHKSMKNKELIKLLALEKSLVFFSTSLKSNEITLEKMLRLDYIKSYPEDKDILDDVIIENKQAIEMANIYSNILSGTMDAFASIISNNLNIVMKLLASITIVMSIPTMISGFFGMNVVLPFHLQTYPYGFGIVITISVIATIGAVYVLAKKDMF
jgi:magnesium transporter